MDAVQTMAGTPRALLCALAALTAACGSGESIGTGAGSFERHEYSSDAGARSYKLFVPESYDGAAWPSR
jgi:poly(3-hydroxybutyrate) depolymerase